MALRRRRPKANTHQVQVDDPLGMPDSRQLRSTERPNRVRSGRFGTTTSAGIEWCHALLIAVLLLMPGATIVFAQSRPRAPVVYRMQVPGAKLPSEATCASQVNATPIAEHAPWNANDDTGYNANVPPAGGIPSYYYMYAPSVTSGELPHIDFAAVDGNYSGTTDDIFRVYSCKWGIDENWARAQAWIETGWHQDCPVAHGGSGCHEVGDLNNPAGCTMSLPITAITSSGEFCALEGFGGLVGPNQYDSWGIFQTKVYYQWMTWPMVEESTAFAVDHRLAECGDA